MPGPLRREPVIGHVLFVSLRCLFSILPVLSLGCISTQPLRSNLLMKF